MRNAFARRPYLVAVVVGVLYSYLGSPISAIYNVANPLDRWFFSAFALKGETLFYYAAKYSHHLLVEALISLPFAYLLSRIAPQNSWKYVWVAVPVILAISLMHFFTTSIDLDFEVVQLARTVFVSNLTTVVAFILAYSVVKKLRRRANAI